MRDGMFYFDYAKHRIKYAYEFFVLFLNTVLNQNFESLVDVDIFYIYVCTCLHILRYYF